MILVNLWIIFPLLVTAGCLFFAFVFPKLWGGGQEGMGYVLCAMLSGVVWIACLILYLIAWIIFH